MATQSCPDLHRFQSQCRPLVCHGCVTATSLQEQLVVLALERERVPSDSRTDESADLNEGFRRGVSLFWAWLGGWVGLAFFVEWINNVRYGSLLP